MQSKDEGRQAVGQLHGDHAERSAAVEGEPHQRDVVERVAGLARRDGAEEEPEVPAPQEPERRGRLGRASSRSRGTSNTGADTADLR
jgi:hypothetical protein